MYGYGSLEMNFLAAEDIIRYFQLGTNAHQLPLTAADHARERQDEPDYSAYRGNPPREEPSQAPVPVQGATHTRNEPPSSAAGNRGMQRAGVADGRPTSSPPAYPSPPDYAPLPKLTETSLLLAPPPMYRRTAVSSNMGETSESAGYDQSDLDVVVVALVLLNIVVWSIVIVAYAAEFMSPGPPDQLFSQWRLADDYAAGPGLWMFKSDECRDGTVAAAFTRTCAAGRCFWGWVDCTEALGIKLLD